MSDEARKWFEVTPKSTSPEDIRAAMIAERIVNSPVFVEDYKRSMRVAGQYLAEKMVRGELATTEELLARVASESRPA